MLASLASVNARGNSDLHGNVPDNADIALLLIDVVNDLNFPEGLLLWQKPFGIGDEIKTKEFEGTVEDITIRTTLLRLESGSLVYIPNGILFTDPVTVNTASTNRRAHIEVPLENITADKAISIVESALQSVGSVEKSPAPEIYRTQASKLDVYFWAPSRKQELLKAEVEAKSAVDAALSQAQKSEINRAA